MIDLDNAERERYLSDLLYQGEICSLADNILGGEAEHRLAGSEFQLEIAKRLARSKAGIVAPDRRARFGIVVPMWRETARLKARADANRGGENSYLSKYRALQWLFSGCSSEWHLYFVDDGCPDGSFEVACDIRNTWHLESNSSVLLLSSALPSKHEPLSKLSNAEMSTKGGAVAFGLMRAIEDGCSIVGYTDCDNSIHLGQLGIVANTVVSGDMDVVSGSRKRDNPYRYWDRTRSTYDDSYRLIRHVQAMLYKQQLPFDDMPAPLKMFAADVVRTVLPHLDDFTFSFDFDLILLMQRHRARMSEVGIVSVDSVDHSTWRDLGDHEVWFQMMHGVLAIAKRHGSGVDDRVENLVKETFGSSNALRRAFEKGCPPELRDVDLAVMGDPSVMSVQRVREWMSH